MYKRQLKGSDDLISDMTYFSEDNKGNRYEIFSEYVDKNSTLFLAHHLDDQVETFFFRIFRGTGMDGIVGIPKERALNEGRLVRPFLGLSKDLLQSYAKKHKLDFINDPSNKDTSFDRNYIRKNIIPKIKQRISTRPLQDFNFILVVIFNFIRAFIINGIWKATPKPNDKVRTKLRKFEISVLTFIDSGPTVWKKLRTLGKTTRKQKLTPNKKRSEPVSYTHLTLPTKRIV